MSPLVPAVNSSLILCNKREKRQATGRGRSGKRGRGNNRKKSKNKKNKKNNKNSIPVTRNIPKGDKCSHTGMTWNSYHPTNTIDRLEPIRMTTLYPTEVCYKVHHLPGC